MEMSDYISDNTQFIVNGFRRAGIYAALDGGIREADEHDQTDDLSDFSDLEASDGWDEFGDSDNLFMN